MFCLPTRGRPANLERFLSACVRSGATAPVWVRIDRDDPTLGDYMAILTGESLPPSWVVVVDERRGAGANDVVREFFATYPELDWYGLLADDVVPRTRAWDFRLATAAGFDRMAFADDLFQGEQLATHPVIGGELARAIGFLAHPKLGHSYVDTLLHAIAEATGRLVYLPDVQLEHMHPLAGKAPDDATYRYAQQFERDRIAFEGVIRDELAAIIHRVDRRLGRRLGEVSA